MSKEIRIGVRDLAFHLYSDGDLTNALSFKNALEDGVKAHDYIQSKYSGESQKEVYIKRDISFRDYLFCLTGFIDGVLVKDGMTIIEEIKSTSTPLIDVNETFHPEYLAQLKIYCYLYCLNNDLKEIRAQLTIVNTKKYDKKEIEYLFTLRSLEEFVTNSLEDYYDWVDLLQKYQEKKEESLITIEFPHPSFRIGQRDLMKAIYSTMEHKGIIYANAPTGIGKTMSAIFSTLKTIKEPNEKIFYATAKSVHKQLAIDSMRLLNQNGLSCKSILLTAKEKICFNKDVCDTNDCPYAKGFFGKLRIATEYAVSRYDCFTYEKIVELARKYELCPFEYSLHLSLFCDVVIGDYNYVFDPQNHLVRFFDNQFFSMKVLIDEAHNLISRANDMYSGIINPNDILELRTLLRGKKPRIESQMKRFENILSQLGTDNKNESFPIAYKEINRDLWAVLSDIHFRCTEIFIENQEFKTRKKALEKYFLLNRWLKISEYFDESRRFIIYKTDTGIEFSILCLNSAKNILNTLEGVAGTVLFSATLTPFKYYKELITMNTGDHLSLPSPFPKENLGIVVVDSISTFYNRRKDTVIPIIKIIKTTINAKKGNYIVFFPSYEYMNLVKDNLADIESEIIIQQRDSTEQERSIIIERFNEEDSPKLGLFVMGGVFSEGVDYLGDMLSGAIIVGVGRPQNSFEKDLAKDYFSETLSEGDDFAYVYPGFNKVVQAAGRVIRSADDKGVIVLIDSRLSRKKYTDMMPNHWKHALTCKTETQLSEFLEVFWDE